jgi:hypothetical protein
MDNRTHSPGPGRMDKLDQQTRTNCHRRPIGGRPDLPCPQMKFSPSFIAAGGTIATAITPNHVAAFFLALVTLLYTARKWYLLEKEHRCAKCKDYDPKH